MIGSSTSTCPAAPKTRRRTCKWTGLIGALSYAEPSSVGSRCSPTSSCHASLPGRTGPNWLRSMGAALQRLVGTTCPNRAQTVLPPGDASNRLRQMWVGLSGDWRRRWLAASVDYTHAHLGHSLQGDRPENVATASVQPAEVPCFALGKRDAACPLRKSDE